MLVGHPVASLQGLNTLDALLSRQLTTGHGLCIAAAHADGWTAVAKLRGGSVFACLHNLTHIYIQLLQARLTRPDEGEYVRMQDDLVQKLSQTHLCWMWDCCSQSRSHLLLYAG